MSCCAHRACCASCASCAAARSRRGASGQPSGAWREGETSSCWPNFYSRTCLLSPLLLQVPEPGMAARGRRPAACVPLPTGQHCSAVLRCKGSGTGRSLLCLLAGCLQAAAGLITPPPAAAVAALHPLHCCHTSQTSLPCACCTPSSLCAGIRGHCATERPHGAVFIDAPVAPRAAQHGRAVLLHHLDLGRQERKQDGQGWWTLLLLQLHLCTVQCRAAHLSLSHASCRRSAAAAHGREQRRRREQRRQCREGEGAAATGAELRSTTG